MVRLEVQESMAVLLAKAKNAYVIGTASEMNKDFVLSIGADEFIDYKTTKFEDVVKEVEVVFDPIGGDIHRRSYQVLKKDGYLVALATTVRRLNGKIRR